MRWRESGGIGASTMQTHTHFRCVFDVSSAENLPKAWLALIGEIRVWVGKKEKTKIKGWFFRGGSWSSKEHSKAHVQVKTITDTGPTPAMWALRYNHRDSKVSARHWITNIGVTQVEDQKWRVAVEVFHGLRPDYLGEKPEEPKASSPNLVTALLNSNRWLSCVGEQRLRGKAEQLRVGEGNRLVELLRNPRRMVPIVLVSCERKTNQPKLNTAPLSADLAGTAAVYVCESTECDEELEHLIPYRFRSPNGTVRIYAPGVNFEQEWTNNRHRFLSARQIDEQGADSAADSIVSALTRSDAWRGLQSSVYGIDDIDARVRTRRLAELLSTDKRLLEEKDEVLELYEYENADQEKQICALEEELESSRKDLDSAEEKIDHLDFDLEQANASAKVAREAAENLKQAVKCVSELKYWPESPSDLAQFAGRVFSDRLVMTPNALKSLETSKFATAWKDGTAVLWRYLRAMANELHPLLFERDELAPGNITELFRQQTGVELAWTETKETKRDNKLMQLRSMVYGEQKVDITPHVKWGNKSPKCLRVHFWVDRDRKQLVIGHCGDHLNTYGTQRRR